MTITKPAIDLILQTMLDVGLNPEHVVLELGVREGQIYLDFTTQPNWSKTYSQDGLMFSIIKECSWPTKVDVETKDGKIGLTIQRS